LEAANGQGVFFSLKHVTGEWQFRRLFLQGTTRAGFPYGGLTFDQSGNVYGTTYYDVLTISVRLSTVAPARGTWSERVLYSFKVEKDGLGSISNLVLGKERRLYGTTSEAVRGVVRTIFKG